MKKFIIALVLILSGISAFGQSYHIHIRVTTRARRHTSVYTSAVDRHIRSHKLQSVSVYFKDIDTGYDLKPEELWDLKDAFAETFVRHYESFSFHYKYGVPDKEFDYYNDYTKYRLFEAIVKKAEIMRKSVKNRKQSAETFKEYGAVKRELARIDGAIEFYGNMRNECYRKLVREYYAKKDAEYKEMAIRDSIAVEKATFHLSSQD